MAKQKLQPGDIRRVLSQAKSKSSSPPTRTANVHEQIQYRVSAHSQSQSRSLVDRGANGGIAGDDVRVISRSHRTVDIQGIDNHQVTDKPIVTAGGVVNTHKGEAIAILHQYAHVGKGNSIHSSGQLEHFKNDVNDQ